jgi:hypothetical protein
MAGSPNSTFTSCYAEITVQSIPLDRIDPGMFRADRNDKLLEKKNSIGFSPLEPSGFDAW